MSAFINQEQNNAFYRVYQPRFIFMLMGAIIVAMIWTGIVVFQVYHRPLPAFYAISPKGLRMTLQPQNEPSLMPKTILQFASKAAVLAYTFDFVNYGKEIGAVRPYFTAGGWSSYLQSIQPIIKEITASKLFVSGVVDGAPIISNQGELSGIYSWQVQMPFLVTYQSAQNSQQTKYTVLITIVKIPTTMNPVGIGVDSFVMV